MLNFILSVVLAPLIHEPGHTLHMNRGYSPVHFVLDDDYQMDVLTFYKLAKRFRHINAFATTVQSAHETGNWTSPLWNNTYNGAGIKADARSNLIVKGMKK